jgi:nitrate/nitrite transporter NarK
MQNSASISRAHQLGEIPRAVWALGFVSLLMDVSSEIIHALLRIYLVTVLSASMLDVGFIEGVAEATASITRVFSGTLADRLGAQITLETVHCLARRIRPTAKLASEPTKYRCTVVLTG